MKSKPPVVLESLLTEAEKHYQRVVELLKVLPPGMDEQVQLLDREGKLAELMHTLKRQIAAKKGT